MSDEQVKQNTSVETNTNQAAEQDAQNVLAELKGQAPAPAPEAEAPKPSAEPAAPTNDEDKEDAEIVAAAKKLGQDSTRGRGGQRTRGRGGKNVNYRENIKSDLTAGEQSSDPVAIRKQVCGRRVLILAL